MEPLKKFLSVIGELLFGIFRPSNTLLFARSLFFWVIIAAVIAIPLFARFVADNALKPASKGEVLSLPDAVLAEVGEQKIYKSDVEKLALETYTRSALSVEVLKTYRDIAIERALLDITSVDRNIVIPDTDITQKLEEERLPVTIKNEQKVYYWLLKEKIMEQSINSRTAHVVEYWTPSITDPEVEGEVNDPKFVAQRQQGREVLLLIEQELQQTNDVLDATRAVLANNSYPELEEVIAVNGLRLSKVTDEFELRKPYTFTTKDQEVMGPEFFLPLFNMQAGEVRVIFRDGDAAGKLYQVIESSQGDYSTYEQWLSDKKQQLVKITVEL